MANDQSAASLNLNAVVLNAANQVVTGLAKSTYTFDKNPFHWYSYAYVANIIGNLVAANVSTAKDGTKLTDLAVPLSEGGITAASFTPSIPQDGNGYPFVGEITNGTSTEWVGVTDCSGFIAYLLQSLNANYALNAWKSAVTAQHPQPWPSASDYASLGPASVKGATLPDNLNSDWNDSWQVVSSWSLGGSNNLSPTDIQAGNIMAYTLPPNATDTGHVWVVGAAPVLITDDNTSKAIEPETAKNAAAGTVAKGFAVPTGAKVLSNSCYFDMRLPNDAMKVNESVSFIQYNVEVINSTVVGYVHDSTKPNGISKGTFGFCQLTSPVTTDAYTDPKTKKTVQAQTYAAGSWGIIFDESGSLNLGLENLTALEILLPEAVRVLLEGVVGVVDDVADIVKALAQAAENAMEKASS